MPDHPSAVSGVFHRPFAEQVAFFRGKLGTLMPTERWDDITGAAHDTAFMVAGAQKADLLADLAAAIDRAIAKGTGLDRFQQEFDEAVEKHEWHGWTGEGTAAGQAWRVRTIYRTNARTSYSAGRRAQLEAASFPLWVYLHGGSRDPRPEHLHVFHGLVLPREHLFWETHFPPSDWGCSCYVVGARSMRAARRLGGDPDKTLPDGWNRIDPGTGEPMGVGRGWGYAPGASVAASIRDKMKAWPIPIAEAFADDQQQLNHSLGLPRAAPVTSIRQLDAGEQEAITSYTGDEYVQINDSLREGQGLTGTAQTVAGAMARASLPENPTLYRGVKGAAARDIHAANPQPGFIITDPAFASSSRLIAKAEQFREADPLGVLMIVHRTRGSNALDVKPISVYPEEEEVLFQHGTRMVVMSWDAETRVLRVMVE